MAINKPDFSRIWANNAPNSSVVDPDTVVAGKFEGGWVEENLFYEFRNYLDNLFSSAVSYINEQGICEWDDATIYPVKSYTKGSDGYIYRCIIENTNDDPVVNANSYWEVALTNKATLEDVANGLDNWVGADILHDLGIGKLTSNQIVIADFNTINDYPTGMYRIDSTTTNRPSLLSGTSGWVVFHNRYNNDYSSGMIVNIVNGTSYTYGRDGVVSQNIQVTETASNTFGNGRKYSDGFVECWGTTSTIGSSSSPRVITFPIAYSSSSTISANVTSNSTRIWSYGNETYYRAVTNTTMIVEVSGNDGSPQTRNIGWSTRGY